MNQRRALSSKSHNSSRPRSRECLERPRLSTLETRFECAKSRTLDFAHPNHSIKDLNFPKDGNEGRFSLSQVRYSSLCHSSNDEARVFFSPERKNATIVHSPIPSQLLSKNQRNSKNQLLSTPRSARASRSSASLRQKRLKSPLNFQSG